MSKVSEELERIPPYSPSIYKLPFSAIEPPIKLRAGEVVELPKQLFPFTEDTLKFELYRKLQETNVKAFLDSEISSVSLLKEALKRKKKFIIPLKPDILISDFMEVWEVESGLTSINLQQANNYSRIIGMPAYMIAWESSYLHKLMERGLILINPLMGKLKFVRCFSSEPFNTAKLKLMKLLLEAARSSYHTLIQYELYRKLRESGYVTTAEVRYGSNIIFAPDDITVSEADGIIDWKPKVFLTRSAEGEYWGKIDILAKSRDETTINGYEVEAEVLDFQQLYNMMSSRVLNRFWIVIPIGLLYKVKYFIANVSHLLLKRAGIIVYYPDEGKFEIFKEAEELAVEKKHTMKIIVES